MWNCYIMMKVVDRLWQERLQIISHCSFCLHFHSHSASRFVFIWLFDFVCAAESLKITFRDATVARKPPNGSPIIWEKRKPFDWCTLNLRWGHGGQWRMSLFSHKARWAVLCAGVSVAHYSLIFKGAACSSKTSAGAGSLCADMYVEVP